MNGKLGKALALIVVLILIGAGVLFAVNNQKAQPSAPITQTPTTEIPEGCPAHPDVVENPTQFLVLGTDNPMKMLSLGLDENGAAAAPPVNEGYTVAWYNEGPKVGSTQGIATLTAHTNYYGGALGNDLQNGAWTENQTVVKISDDEGRSACYRYSGSEHIMVADYDKDVNSHLIYDEEGDPRFALVVCSDLTNDGTYEFLGRIIYYGKLISVE